MQRDELYLVWIKFTPLYYRVKIGEIANYISKCKRISFEYDVKLMSTNPLYPFKAGTKQIDTT